MVTRWLVVPNGFASQLPVSPWLALAGCGSSSDRHPQAATPFFTQTTASVTESVPDKAKSPSLATREVYDLAGFISPSENVACMIEPAWVRCDIIDNDWSPPPRPVDCEFDYGQGITLGAGGRAEFVCAGDTAFGPDEVLPCGSSIVAGVLQCDSAESGFTCRDVELGHGFSISREAYRLF